MAEYQLLCWKLLYLDGGRPDARRIKSAKRGDFASDPDWDPVNFEIFEPGKKNKIPKDFDLRNSPIYWDPGVATGSHTGADNASALVDSTQSFVVDEHIDKWIFNVDDGSYAQITANTATSVVGALKLGSDNDWDIGDDYYIAEYYKGAAYPRTSPEIEQYLGANVVWHDSVSDLYGPAVAMQVFVNRREIYGDAENPLGAYAGNMTGRINNLELNQSKGGWRDILVREARYSRPLDLLIYYGWLNSFNSNVNGWNNEKVAQDLAKYNVLVFGDGIQDSGHGDYANTSVVIPRIKALNPQCLIFGYVTINQTLSNFEDGCDGWDTLGAHGIFLDEAGYDYGSVATNGRAAFNVKVDYVHDLTTSKLCFANAWNMDHIIGTVNDTSYPNTTWNSGVVESSLGVDDWYLLESSPINTDAFTGADGYQSKTDWIFRAEKAVSHRAAYSINLAAVGKVNSGNDEAKALFEFGFIAACMHTLEAFGVSDTLYGASSAKTDWYPRPDVSGLGIFGWKYPGVVVDTGDSDRYLAYTEFGRLVLDFSSDAELSFIEKKTEDYDDPSRYWKIDDHFEGQYLNNIWLPSNSGANSTIVKKVGSPSAQTFRAGDAVGRYATLLNAYQTIGVDQEPLMKAGIQLVHISNISVYFGLWDSVSDKIEFFADTGSGYWVARNTDGGATTSTITSVALDTDWHRFEICVTGSRVLFFIDRVLVAAHRADITVEEMYLRFQVVTDAGTVVREANLDYFWTRGKVGY